MVVVDLNILLQIVEQYGLFVALVIYVLWQNQKREERYINVIEKLSRAFEALKKDISQIKDKIFEKEDDNE